MCRRPAPESAPDRTPGGDVPSQPGQRPQRHASRGSVHGWLASMGRSSRQCQRWAGVSSGAPGSRSASSGELEVGRVEHEGHAGAGGRCWIFQTYVCSCSGRACTRCRVMPRVGSRPWPWPLRSARRCWDRDFLPQRRPRPRRPAVSCRNDARVEFIGQHDGVVLVAQTDFLSRWPLPAPASARMAGRSFECAVEPERTVRVAVDTVDVGAEGGEGPIQLLQGVQVPDHRAAGGAHPFAG